MVDVPVTQQTPLVIVTVLTNGQTVFDYDFRVDKAEDLRARYVAIDGTKTELVGVTDFDVSGLGNGAGGSITLTSFSGTEAGQDLVIYRAIPIARPTDYSRDLFAEDINAEQDRIFMILQDLQRSFDDVLRVDPGEDPPDIQSIFDAVTTSTVNAATASGAAASAVLSAGAAANSEIKAQEWAENPEDDPVEPGQFSAKHWAAKAEQVVLDGLVDGSVTTQKVANYAITPAKVSPGFSFGQCILRLSGANLSLDRLRGKLITINGIHQEIPAVGPSLSPAGLTPLTLYYIYAYMNAGTMTLEASVTAYAIDSATGVAIKSGDATRTLVGMAYPEAGPVFTDTAKKRFVRSWFNDHGVKLLNNFTANRTRANNVYGEVNSEIRCEFLLWSGEIVDATINGSAQNSTASGGVQMSIGFDTTSAVTEPGGSVYITTGTTPAPVHAQALKIGLSEGYHYATLLGATQASGTALWYGDSDGRKTTLTTRVTK